VHYAQDQRGTSGASQGEFVTCFVADGTAQLWWVDAHTFTVGVLKKGPGTFISSETIDAWWKTKILPPR
jgi:serine/threonine-protein kinase